MQAHAGRHRGAPLIPPHARTQAARYTFTAMAQIVEVGLVAMDENRARRVVDALRERGVPAHVAHTGVGQIGVRIVIFDGREAIWDADGAAGLEANVMRDGTLVGFVPMIQSALMRPSATAWKSCTALSPGFPTSNQPQQSLLQLSRTTCTRRMHIVMSDEVCGKRMR